MILADEPTGNLDSETSIEVMALFQELWQSGITIVLVTHEPDIAAFAGRVIDMKDGRVRSDRRQAAGGRARRADARRARSEPPRTCRTRSRRMTGVQTLRIAGKALLRNKMRSFLTTLGIIIGVGAVIAMVAIGDGAKAMVEKSFAAMGSNLLIVMSGTTTAGGARGGFGSLPTLTWDDLAAIQREVLGGANTRRPQLRSARPGDHRGAELDHQRHRHDARVLPDPQLADRAGGAVRRPATSTARPRSSCSGQTVVDKLFGPNANPVGQAVRDPQHPVPGGRRAGAQGAVADGAGLRRRACSSRRRRS